MGVPGNEYQIEEKYYKHYDFLEKLRKSGITNMFGAAPYLQAAFKGLSKQESHIILAGWMYNYDKIKELRGWSR